MQRRLSVSRCQLPAASYEPNSQLLKDNSHCVRLVDNPAHAARDADLVVTDVWASMGSEAEALQHKQHFGGFR